MASDAELRRSADRINSYITKYIRLAGTERKEEVLKMFDNLHLLFPHWVIGTCPMMHPEICYISKNAESIFGYSSQFIIENSRPEKFFNLVHQLDRADLYRCIEFLREEMENLPPEIHHEYRCVFHYRFRKNDDTYCYLHDEKASLQLSDGSSLYYVLFHDITSERSFSGVKAEFFHHLNSIKKLKEFNPALFEKKLSKREIEIVALMRQGLSNKEIAGYLALSQNTIRNMKSKLFEKYNVGNSIELLNHAL